MLRATFYVVQTTCRSVLHRATKWFQPASWEVLPATCYVARATCSLQHATCSVLSLTCCLLVWYERKFNRGSSTTGLENHGHCKGTRVYITSQRALNYFQRSRLSRRLMIWLLPHPLPLSLCAFFLSLPVCNLSSLTAGKGGGVWEEPNHATAKKAGSSINHLIYKINSQVLLIERKELAFMNIFKVLFCH